MPTSILKSSSNVDDDPTPPSGTGALSVSSSLSFNRRTRVYLIPTRAELSQEEFLAAFLSKADLTEVRDGIVHDMKAMRDNEVEEDDDGCDEGPCFRGIEYMHSNESIQKRQDHKTYVTNSILAAQREGADSNHIASISSRVSRWAVDSALIRAAADAAFVRRVAQNKTHEEQLAPSAPSLTNDDSSHRSQALINTLDRALYVSNRSTCEDKNKVDIRRSNSFPTLELAMPSWVITGVPSAAITTHAVALDLAIIK